MDDFGKTSKNIAVKKITIKPKLREHLINGEDATTWQGVRAVFLNYGAVLHQLWLPGHTDTGGKKKTVLSLADVVLGYPDPAGYEKNPAYLGAVVGRVAGRISGARFAIPFEMDNSISSVFKLTKNHKHSNCIHGGNIGLTYKVWEIVEVKPNMVKFKVLSPDGEDGFPGKLTVFVTYKISVEDEDQVVLSVDFFAIITDGICPVNLTNQMFFNLAGHRAGPDAIDRLFVTIKAEKMCETEGAELIPTGRLIKVGKIEGTDLRKSICIKEMLRQIRPAPNQGFDDYFIFRDLPYWESKVTASDSISGRSLDIFTDQPGVHFYSGNLLDPKTNPVGKDGYSYPPHSGLCFMSQGYPDAINRCNFPKFVVAPNGKNYSQSTRYVFSAKTN